MDNMCGQVAHKRNIAVVTASEMTVSAFLINHIRMLSEKHDVVVITNTDNVSVCKSNAAVVAGALPIPIQRDIRPVLDFFTLIRLAWLLRKKRFDLVFSVTPKAGLLAMLAGFIARVPIRIHMFTGQVWATKVGFVRILLKSLDRVISKFSTHLLADSSSQREFLEQEGVVGTNKVTVLADGSISGVDVERFKPDLSKKMDVRSVYGIPADSLVLLFLGRLKKDKGVLDLAAAFDNLHAAGHGDLHLLVVGPDEGGMRMQMERILSPSALSKVHFVDFTDCPEKFMSAADIFCLPSYREGFGSVVLEAAACGMPAVASRIYGLTDAVEEEVTGLLHRPGDRLEMYRCIAKLVDDSVLREQMGRLARRRAIDQFSHERVTGEFVKYISTVLSERQNN